MSQERRHHDEPPQPPPKEGENDPAAGFHYESAAGCCTNAYILPRVRRILQEFDWADGSRRVFDLGCGNGAVAQQLTQWGYEVTGVDPSEEGIALARRAYPGLKVEVGTGYDDLAGRYGTFPVVISLEVIEHVYDPRTFARRLAGLLRPGGLAILSTPYHGYLKNLVLALTNKLDAHFTALWDHGHIKFWSVRSLTILLEEAGLRVEEVYRVGRIPALAKSMVVCARKQAGP
jgi:2-polyprenyl-3-methyl-5-hydroxy-6-metoxy-1,4-benzoquinol methylase